MIELSDTIDSLFDYYWDLTIIERTDLFLRLMCFGLAVICILLSVCNWSFGFRDLGFIFSMALVYSASKACLVMLEVTLPE
jgi:hypothetical protein